MSTKRRHNDENTPTFVQFDPTAPKRRRRTAQTVGFAELQNMQRARASQDAAATALSLRAEQQRRVTSVLNCVADVGYSSVHEFVLDLFDSGLNDTQTKSKVARMLGHHADAILDAIRARQPQKVVQWALGVTGNQIAYEGQQLAAYLRPDDSLGTSDMLTGFSLDRTLASVENIAPNLCTLLRMVVADGDAASDGDFTPRKDKNLVLVTVICMLAQTRNERASEFQSTMCLYLLACGASRSQFDVLNHAGFTLSYTSAIAKIRELGREKLAKIVEISHTRPFMIIWDNLNIAFRVAEQRKESKDHFDNGTTATLIPLFGVAPGSLPLSLKPTPTIGRPFFEITEKHLLPSVTQVRQLEGEMLWHIQDILFDAYPTLRDRFREQIGPAADITPIPLHTTEQFPLPAMHIDESSLDGTLSVLNSIISKTLQLSNDDIEKQGIIFCAGDQLSISLLEKVSASRRDDSTLIDNIGRYTEGQLGIFHIKMAGDRMVANEFWGVANSRSPWSLWKVNSLLGRKAISAGWKAKTLLPFRPTYELILQLALPANILDGFRMFCNNDSLDAWVDSLTSIAEVQSVASIIQRRLCSARRVSELRGRLHRDVPLENIILFNRDALILRALKYSIKRGDIGTVINVLSYWMVMFRGTGKMPKYADALFQLLARLDSMEAQLRSAFLNHWLANLSGKPNGFKEMDLLQEHQNFWAKIIYCARGANRSWDWLAMVTVSIFALRDAIRRVQESFKIPYNGKSHTSPSTGDDIADLREYLKVKQLQSYKPQRDGNDFATPVRDLLATGAAYANTAAAFKNFRQDKSTVVNHGVPIGVPVAGEESEEAVNEDDELDLDLGADIGINIEDLAIDTEEFPADTDLADFVLMARDAVEELSCLE